MRQRQSYSVPRCSPRVALDEKTRAGSAERTDMSQTVGFGGAVARFWSRAMLGRLLLAEQVGQPLFAIAARFAQNTRPLCVVDPVSGLDAIFSPLEGLRLRPASLAAIRASPMKVPA